MHLFTKLAFAALMEISGMRYKVAVQINLHLRTLPTQDTEHIPRLMHAEKLRLLSDPPGTLGKGLADAHSGEKDQTKIRKGRAVG